MLPRRLIVAALAAAVAVPSAQGAAPAGPTGLRGFLLRADEPALDTFPRTPSFAWTPLAGAVSYDFELATSRAFDESSVVWSTRSRATPLRVPMIAIPLALPWMTGNPYALYAHVRARTVKGITRWSRPFGFNMRWNALPEEVLPTIPGLVHWKPIEGATSYDVWFLDAKKVITTTTNVADEREYYSFHPQSSWIGAVQWRVRAVRKLYGSLPNGLPVVSVGPWSDTFVSTNPDIATGPISLIESASDVFSTPTTPTAHSLTPGFAFTGNMATNGQPGRLFRVYIATDPQCVNIVFKGSVVGSPAYAPRTSGPIELPTSTSAVTTAEGAYAGDGLQKGTFTADLGQVETDEDATTKSTSTPPDFSATGSLVDLWDSGWPTGRYYWTVVPVREMTTGTGVGYYDAEVPQDSCAAGRVAAFGKTSQPATTSASSPYVSGLAPSGELVAAQDARPSFYRAALIAWEPAFGATGYEVQWSRTRYPWRPASTTPYYTAATSALLEGLATGVWYYRVRGIDPYLQGPVKQMTWSTPQQFRLAKPRFSIQGGSVTTRPVKR
jgi:hypothetical protein